jgi:hypothetical protein
MDDLTVARAIHVAGVVFWIGGVAFVTTVLLPGVRRMKDPQDRVSFFEQVEGKFAWQARVTTLLVGVSGFYITAVLDLWSRFESPGYWWMHAIFLHRWFIKNATEKPESTFLLIERLHRVLLAISILTVLGAVAGSHGMLF